MLFKQKSLFLRALALAAFLLLLIPFSQIYAAPEAPPPLDPGEGAIYNVSSPSNTIVNYPAYFSASYAWNSVCGAFYRIFIYQTSPSYYLYAVVASGEDLINQTGNDSLSGSWPIGTPGSYEAQFILGAQDCVTEEPSTLASDIRPFTVLGTTDITANGSQGPLILASGENLTLAWVSEGVTPTCTLTLPVTGPGGVPSTGNSGSLTPSHPDYPPDNGNSLVYEISCNSQNGAGIVTDSVFAKRGSLAEDPEVNLIISVDGSPDQDVSSITVTSLQTIELTWASQSASQCNFTEPFDPDQGDIGLAGSSTFTPSNIYHPTNSPTESYTYTVSCNNGSIVAEDSITVSVYDPPPPPNPQCSDNIDNDGDGLIDHPADPGCAGPTDDNETDPPPPLPPSEAYITIYLLEQGTGNWITSGSWSFGSNPAGAVDPASSSIPAVFPMTNLEARSHTVTTDSSGVLVNFTVNPIDGYQYPPVYEVASDGSTYDNTNSFTIYPTDEVSFIAVFAPEPVTTQCSDGIDNTDPEDTLVDMLDPGCAGPGDNDETDPPLDPQCDDGIDNTDPEDTLVDMNDPGCAGPGDNDETDPPLDPQCSDGIDNTDPEDTLVDMNDPGCAGPGDNDETDPPLDPQCSDGIDNTDPEDTLVDMSDPGCAGPGDNDETDPPLDPQCDDGIDNTDPEDTLIDMSDPGCAGPGDNDETDIGEPDATINVTVVGGGPATWVIEFGGYTASSNVVPASAGGTSYIIDATPGAGYVVTDVAACQDGINHTSCTSNTNSLVVFPDNVKSFKITVDEIGSTQCSDGIDNTDPEDTLVDMSDPGCAGPGDNDETDPPLDPQCDDGIDNTDPEDTLIDMSDPGCAGPGDNDETDPPLDPQCDDGIDNTDPEDTLVDMLDPGCAGPGDNDETDIGSTECSDGIDNADPEDTLVDMNDPGCAGPGDNDETDIGSTECSDGIDNADPEDTLVDMNDPGCAGPGDNDETDIGSTECSDGIDNADPEDTLVDMNDPGCAGPGDNDETDPPPTGTAIIKVSEVNGAGSWAINPGNHTGTNNSVPASAGGTTYFITVDPPIGLDYFVKACENGLNNTICNGEINDPDSDLMVTPDSTKSFVITYTWTGGECDNGLDDDGDGPIDMADPDCESPLDPIEAPTYCSDGVDNGVLGNDGDGLVDLADPGCTDENDNDEHPFNSSAQAVINVSYSGGNGIWSINPGDHTASSNTVSASDSGSSYIITVDPGPGYNFSVAACQNGTNNTSCTNNLSSLVVFSNNIKSFVITFEPSSVTQCSDNIDNDRDNLTDLNDPGCNNDPNDDDETDPPIVDPFRCSDGIDNDSDGLIDFPQDPGCTAPTDNDEYNIFLPPPPPPPPGSYQCNDFLDNDDDNLVDMDDTGCSEPTDDIEANIYPPPSAQCSDGIDNDSDGLIDHPADLGCASPWDNNENNGRPPEEYVATINVTVNGGDHGSWLIMPDNHTGTSNTVWAPGNYIITVFNDSGYTSMTAACQGPGDTFCTDDISALDISGEEVKSFIITFSSNTLLEDPDISASSNACLQVSVNLSDASSPQVADSFRLWRDINSGFTSPVDLGSHPGPSTIVLDSVAAGGTYYYRAQSVVISPYQESGYSDSSAVSVENCDANVVSSVRIVSIKRGNQTIVYNDGSGGGLRSRVYNGDELTLDISLNNVGGLGAEDISITNNYSSNLQVIDFSCSGCASAPQAPFPSGNSGSLGDLPPDSTWVVTMRIAVNSNRGGISSLDRIDSWGSVLYTEEGGSDEETTYRLGPLVMYLSGSQSTQFQEQAPR